MYGVQEDVDGGDHGVCWAGAGVPGGGAGRLQTQTPPHTRHRGGGAEVSSSICYTDSNITSAANRLIGEVVQSRRRPLLGPSPG